MVDAFFTNYSDTTVTLTCSGVTGFEGGANEYVSLSVEIPPHTGNDDGNLFWFEDDFEGGGMGTGLISINCRLPAGVGINDTYLPGRDGAGGGSGFAAPSACRGSTPARGRHGRGERSAHGEAS